MIDRKSYKPYYLQVKEYLQKGIDEGEYPAGSKIHSESELMRLFGVSRVTVRQALEALAQAGYLEKRQGKGTFARHPKVTQELNVITSWAETMQSRGLHPETRAFSCCEMPAGETLAEVLGIAPGDPVYAIERLRYAGGEPICIMKNYIPTGVAPDIIQKSRIRDGIYIVLEEEYGLTLATATETIGAHAANSKEAAQLLVRRGSPILSVQRVTFGPNGKPIELAVVSSVADKYAYVVRMEGRPQK